MTQCCQSPTELNHTIHHFEECVPEIRHGGQEAELLPTMIHDQKWLMTPCSLLFSLPTLMNQTQSSASCIARRPHYMMEMP